MGEANFLLLILCTSFLIFEISCVKENPEIKKNKNLNFSSRSSDYPFSNFLLNYATLQNGILTFPNWQTYINYTEYLRLFENDTANFNTANSYLESNNLEKSSNPVLEDIELINQFSSSRKKYELLSIQSKIESDNPEDYINHFMFDPYFETTLNEYNEVKIGSIYFRLIDQNKTVLVGNSDLMKFISTRSQTNFVPYQNRNNVFLMDLGIADINLVFNQSEENARASIRSFVMPDFSYEFQTNGTYKFRNISFFDAGNGLAPVYKWTFSNGNEYIGFEPPDQLINSSEETPASCQLEITNFSSPFNKTIEELVPQICSHSVTICPNGNTITIDIRNESWYPQGCPVTWDFGDGTTGSGPFVTHTYSTNPPSNLTKIFKIKGRLKCGGECDLWAKFSISLGCNAKGSRTKNYDMIRGPESYRIIATVWASENIMGGSAGASTESFIRPNQNVGFQKFFTYLGVSTQGTVWLNINGCCVLQPVPFSSTSSLANKISLINRFTQSSRVRYLPNEFWSTHSLQMIGGQIFNSGENLYLQ